MTVLQLAFLDLIRKKSSTIIAVISISVCVACGGLLLKLTILSGARFDTLVKGPEVVIGAKAGGIEILLGSMNLEGPYPDFIPGQLYRTLRQKIQFEDGGAYDPSAIRTIVPIVIFGRYHTYRVLGTDQEFFSQPRSEDNPVLVRGEWFGPGSDVVVGSEVARSEKIDVGDTLPVTPWTSQHEGHSAVVRLRVVGIFKAGVSSWNRACISSMAEADRVFNSSSPMTDSTTKFDALHYLLAYIRPGGYGSISALINRRSVAELISVSEQELKLNELTGTGIQLGWLMAVLILLLSILSVAGVMISRFESMKIQIAVLRALGFNRFKIGRWLITEGAILGLTSCILGAMLDILLFPLFRILLGSALPSEDIVPTHFYFSAPFWIATILGTIIAVLIPFFQMARQDPHSSLKGL